MGKTLNEGSSMVNKKIEAAIKLLEPINYEPFEYGYFVLKNDDDMGDSDYCINCIDSAVKEASKYHKFERARIIEKFKQISKFGCFKQGEKMVFLNDRYTKKQISDAKRNELKEYPTKAVFTYEGHDPDFGGGLTEPCSCNNCGEYFVCNFEADKNEAEHLLYIVGFPDTLTEKEKWELNGAFDNYAHVSDEVKKILVQVAEKILKK